MLIRKILTNLTDFENKSVKLKAWVSANRGNNKIRFLAINDGSSFEDLQIVAKQAAVDLTTVEKAKIGSAVAITGLIVVTPQAKQICELQVTSFILLAPSDPDFPIQKKEMSLPFLREIPHLRHRTKLFRAVMRIRSTLMHEIYQFMEQHHFCLAAAPIITGVDGEGAGESFVLKTAQKGDFYDRTATLGVTGQLHAEAYAIGFGRVYSFNPIFRAETSHTTKHASEFWMLEPEVAFHKMADAIELADHLCKTIIQKTLTKHAAEFAFLETEVAPHLRAKLEQYLSTKMHQIEYADAILALQKVNHKFIKKVTGWVDLATEHEKYLAEELFQGPVAVINYPKQFKAFYMYQNDDQTTVAAFDILVPGIGELLGGSQREHRYEKLLTRINELKIETKSLEWYLNLRRFGDAGSAGFGIGFERLMMYVTGVENIRDTIAFPRTSGQLRM